MVEYSWYSFEGTSVWSKILLSFFKTVNDNKWVNISKICSIYDYFSTVKICSIIAHIVRIVTSAVESKCYSQDWCAWNCERKLLFENYFFGWTNELSRTWITGYILTYHPHILSYLFSNQRRCSELHVKILLESVRWKCCANEERSNIDPSRLTMCPRVGKKMRIRFIISHFLLETSEKWGIIHVL